MVPREPSALPGAWPPAQTLASPPEAALGTLSPCQGALGAQASPPRPGHQPSSAICLLLDTEKALQDMLEHACPLQNEQVLRVSAACRGQRARRGVLSLPAPALLGQEPVISWGGACIPSHLLSWQVPLAKGEPLPPQPQLRLQRRRGQLRTGGGDRRGGGGIPASQRAGGGGTQISR